MRSEVKCHCVAQAQAQLGEEGGRVVIIAVLSWPGIVSESVLLKVRILH